MLWQLYSYPIQLRRLHQNLPSYAMSFSNTTTGDAPADPYKKANQEDIPLKTKVDDLVEFINKCKFGMMTTRGSASGNLVSRCMALAATVGLPQFLFTLALTTC